MHVYTDIHTTITTTTTSGLVQYELEIVGGAHRWASLKTVGGTQNNIGIPTCTSCNFFKSL